MKFLSLLVFVPFFASASTCFVADRAVPAELPTSFCVTSIHEEMRDDLVMKSISKIDLPKDLKIIDKVMTREDRFKFIAKATLVDHLEQMCGYQIRATLFVKGRSSQDMIATDELEISAQVSETNDNCHSDDEVYTVNYKKI